MIKRIFLHTWLLPFYSCLLYALSIPDVNFWPLAWVAFVPLVAFCLRPTKWYTALFLFSLSWFLTFLYGYFGFSYYSTGNYIFLALVETAFMVPMLMIVRLFIRTFPKMVKHGGVALAALGSAAVWVLCEVLRSNLPIIQTTGAGLLGYTQYLNYPVLEWAAFVGVYGVTALLIFVNVVIAFTIRHYTEGSRKGLPKTALVTCMILVVVFGYGMMRSTRPYESDRAMNVAVVQTYMSNVELNTDPDMERMRKQVIDAEVTISIPAFKDLLSAVSISNPELVVFPERIFPNNFNDASKQAQKNELCSYIGSLKLPCIIGASTGVQEEEADFNSAYFISGDGKEAGRYDKMVLYPIHEYLPGSSWLSKALIETKAYTMLPPELIEIPEGEPFTLEGFLGKNFLKAGTDHVIFDVNGVKVAPLICVEDIMPWMAGRVKEKGADLIAVLSDDGWFRDTAILQHHFVCSIFRAVEQNISIVRATNSGISGLISPRGKVIKTVNVNGRERDIRGIAVAEVPIVKGRTVFAQYGTVFLWVYVGIVVILLIVCALGALRVGRK